MKINFVVPFINWTGGIRVVFEYAERLHRRGHDVIVYVPVVPYTFGDNLSTIRGLRRWLGDLALNVRRRTNQKWFDLSAPLVMVPSISDPFIRDADATVATAWPTAYSIHRLRPTKGTMFYLVQGYETWSGDKATVDGSYSLPLHKVAVSSWLRDLIKQNFDQPVLDVITNGIDFSVFYQEGPSGSKAGRILMQYSPLETKGVADALEAWGIVRRRRPEAQLVMFGLERGANVPPETEFHLNPSQNSLRGVYNSCEIFVSTSRMEGHGLTPMEAMACGCAVAATNVGGVPDYTIPGETALVIEPRDVEGMAEAIIRLLQHDDERHRIAQAGHQYIQQFGWDRAVQRFESALERGTDSR